jgi:hypothetical protein
MDEPVTSQDGEENIAADYANNVRFVANVWDLKILFGELSVSKPDVDWHTSITLPWAQAKLMAYYLSINIAAYEAHHGGIRLPESMLPLEPPPPPLETGKDDPSHKVFEFVREQRQKFLNGQK